jgi:CRP-like cAMP-binding protein
VRLGADVDRRPVNHLLRALAQKDYDLVAPSLEWHFHPEYDQLYDPGENVDTVYFPCSSSLASLRVANADGRDVETVLVGREGAVGGIVSSGNVPAFCRIIVKNGGDFVRLPVAALERAKNASPTFHSLFSRYADCLLAQVFQSTACNAIHSVEQRTAKWLLEAAERTSEHDLSLDQEELAGLLGVGRAYTNRILQTFKADETLELARGRISILNLNALKRRSCGCRKAVKRHFTEVLGGVYPRSETSQGPDPHDVGDRDP